MNQLPTIGQRLDRALLHLELAAQGPAVKFDRELVSKSPELSTDPPAIDPTGQILRDAARRTIIFLETGTRTPLRRVIRRYEG